MNKNKKVGPPLTELSGSAHGIVSGHLPMFLLLLFACWEILNIFCRCLIFSKSTFSNSSFRNAIRVSNSLDLGQARHHVGPDLGPNCLQRLSMLIYMALNTSRQRVYLCF